MWQLMFAANWFIIVSTLVAGLGFGGYASVNGLVRSISTYRWVWRGPGGLAVSSAGAKAALGTGSCVLLIHRHWAVQKPGCSPDVWDMAFKLFFENLRQCLLMPPPPTHTGQGL